LGKFKAKWQKTDIPKRIKIELWQVMKDNPTQTTREQAMAHLDKNDELYSWAGIHRDTWKALWQELIETPVEEVNQLPQDLQPWIRGLEEWQKISTRKEDISKHWDKLLGAAESLSEQLRSINRYMPKTDNMIGDIAVDYNKQEFLEFIDDPWANRLLSHMKAELPELQDLRGWADLKVKDITQELLNKLSLRADRREFKGKCKICED